MSAPSDQPASGRVAADGDATGRAQPQADAAAPIRLRAASDADGAFLTWLEHERLVAELRLADWPEAERAPLVALQADMRRRGYSARFPTAETRILDRPEGPAGMVIVDIGPDRLRLVDLVVVPALRRRGIARATLRALLAEAGPRPVGLSVLRFNLPARALYADLGFVETAADPLRLELWHGSPPDAPCP